MTDDLSRVIGRLEAGFDAIKEHLERQDAQHASDKAEAKQAREEKHRDVTRRIDAVDARIGTVEGRVKVLEDLQEAAKEKKRLASAEFRGRAKTWAKIGAGAMLAVTALGYLGRDTWAAVLQRAVNLLRSM